MDNLIIQLAEKCAASGCEDEIRTFLTEKLSALEIEYDAHGSLIAHKKGVGKPIAVIAALDVPSLFITHIEKNGFVRFCTCGIDHKKLRGVRVRLKNGTSGVVFSEKDKEEMCDMFIGFPTNASVLQAEPAMIDMPPTVQDGLISGFACANYGAMAALLEAATAKTERDAYFIFVGKSTSGKYSPTFMKKIPQDAEVLCLDKSEANDLPGERNLFVRLGGGVCVRMMDKSVISSSSLAKQAISFSDEVKLQREVSKRNGLGGTLQTYGAGVPVLSLGIAARYCDEICEVADMDDIKAAAELLIKFLGV